MTRRLAMAGVACAMALVLCGCGDSAPTAAESAPFGTAIARYLKDHSMGMKVAEFKSLEIDGDAATAACSMQEASGLYRGVSVRWTFEFRRDEDGAWQVERLDKP